MSSFSDRLKKIRENRSLRKGSPQIGTADPTKHTVASDLVTTSSSLTTSISTSPALSTHSTSSSLSYNDFTATPSTLMQPRNILEKSTEVLRSISSDRAVELTRGKQKEDLSISGYTSDGSKPSTILEDQGQYKSQEEAEREFPSKDILSHPASMSEDTLIASETTVLDQGEKNLSEDIPLQLSKHSLTLDLQLEEEDEIPTAPPPPVPDLPPPPDDLPMDVESEEPSHPSDKPKELERKEPMVTTKSSFRTAKRKKDWMRKSEELDSSMFDPLPLLVSTKPGQRPEPVPEEVENSQLDIEEETMSSNEDNLHGSAESLPSLPDSPPPQLPDGPPPDLPSSFLSDGMEYEPEEGIVSETLLTPLEDDGESNNVTTPDIDDATAVEPIITVSQSEPSPPALSTSDSALPIDNEQIPTTYSDEVTLRKPKRALNGGSPQTLHLHRRSAFDAMVSVELSTEEKREPKLSPRQRRSLALESSRRSNADTSPLLDKWKHETIPTSIERLDTIEGQANLAILKETVKSESSRGLGSTASAMPKEEVQDKKLLSVKRVGQDRPRSIAGISDLKLDGGESRWSLPPDSDVFQTVKKSDSFSTIPDRNLTKVTKSKWKNTDLLTTDAASSLSASTGQLFSNTGGNSNQQRDGGNSEKSSSSESLPLFKKSPSRWREGRGVSPLAATVNIAGVNKEDPGSVTQVSEADSMEIQLPNQVHSDTPERNSLIPSEDDSPPTTQETSHEYGQEMKVPLRRNVKNLRIAAVQADSRGLDSPRPASLVLDRDILKVCIYVQILLM